MISNMSLSDEFIIHAIISENKAGASAKRSWANAGIEKAGGSGIMVG
jgi:hypothetical protein